MTNFYKDLNVSTEEMARLQRDRKKQPAKKTKEEMTKDEMIAKGMWI